MASSKYAFCDGARLLALLDQPVDVIIGHRAACVGVRLRSAVRWLWSSAIAYRVIASCARWSIVARPCSADATRDFPVLSAGPTPRTPLAEGDGDR
jgi:hypothetical protein